MRRINTSSVALAMSALALFLAMGGTAVAVSQIGTAQIRNGAVTKAKLHRGAVTKAKLHRGAVTGSKLAAGSVNSAKVANGSLTASDVASGTFLAAGATAADSSRLGGLLPADFVQGVGIMNYRRVVVPESSSEQFLSTGFGTFTGGCSATGQLTVTWRPTVTNAEFLANVTAYPGSSTVNTANGIGAGVPYAEPSAISGPFSVTYQVGYTSGLDHVATVFVTGRYENPAGCVFIGQQLSSG